MYKRPGDRYVIKVFNQDPGYLEYLDYVLANQSNPHVPKIRGRYMKINDDTYAVRMEELTDMDNDYRSEDRRILQMIEGADFRHAAQNAYLQEHLPQLAQLMRDLDKMGLENDIYYGNVMKRGDTLVITDPVR